MAHEKPGSEWRQFGKPLGKADEGAGEVAPMPFRQGRLVDDPSQLAHVDHGEPIDPPMQQASGAAQAAAGEPVIAGDFPDPAHWAQLQDQVPPGPSVLEGSSGGPETDSESPVNK